MRDKVAEAANKAMGYDEGCIEGFLAADAAIAVVIEECAKAIDDDATKCDCAAFSASECNCGSWEDYKRITSARAAEIVRALSQESADEG